MTIKARLGIFISVTMGFSVFIAIIGYWGAVNLSSKLNEMGRDGVFATRYLAETQDAMWQLRFGISQYVAVPDPASREKIVNESPKWFGIMDGNLKRYADGNLPKEAKDGLQKMIETYEQYKEARPKWMKLMAGTVNESSLLIASLGKRSKQIGEIIGVIDEIANQTNLLALNAAIEAARAGDQGRGFAVVADEVKKLAEKTAKSTSEIEPMIKDIQDEVQKAVSSMQEVTKRVEVGVALSTQAGGALHDIVKSVNDLQSMVQQIAAATEEMSTVSETIGGDIEKIAVFSKETSTSAGEVAKSSTDLAMLASNLQGIVTHFKIA